jgi:serine/threonine protein kinase
MSVSVSLTLANGDKYVGAVDEKQRPHGVGVYTRSNGAVYEGEHVHGKRHGHGEFRGTDGSVYRGAWLAGVQQGVGVYTFGPTTPWAGDEYRGAFLNGAWNGHGEYAFANGDHYAGDYRDGKQHGVGKFTNANGSAYVGQFRAGVPHGLGAFFLHGRRIPRTTGLYDSGSLVHSDRSLPDDAPEPTLAELRAKFAAAADTSSSNSSSSPLPLRHNSDDSAVADSPATPSDDSPSAAAFSVPASTAVMAPVASPVAPSRGKKKRSHHTAAPATGTAVAAAIATANSPSAAAAATATAAVSPVGSPSTAPALRSSPDATTPLGALENKARDLRRQLIAIEKLIAARGGATPSGGGAGAAPQSPKPHAPMVGETKKVSVTSDFAERPLLAREDAAIARLHIDSSSTSVDDDDDGAGAADVEGADGVKRVDFRRRIKQLLFSSQPASTMAVSQSTIAIDIDQLHKAELLEPIGGGGSGCKIYRASVKGFSFVVKLYRTALLTPLDEELIKKEILIMEALDHPNIVHYIGHDFSQPDCVRLYMELFLSTLHREIRHRADEPRRPFALDELLALALGIASGLQYLHTLPCPIVHRDLKCLARDTPVLMADGGVRAVQTIGVGERVMGDDGTPRTVLSVTAGRDQLYAVGKGRHQFTCNSAHVLSLKLRDAVRVDHCTLYAVCVERHANGTASALREAVRTFDSAAEAAAAYAVAAAAQDETIDIAISTLLDERSVSESLRARLMIYFAGALEFGEHSKRDTDADEAAYELGLSLTSSSGKRRSTTSGECARLPHAIRLGSLSERLALLAGIVDGNACDERLLFALSPPSLLADVVFVARSVGCRAERRGAECVELWSGAATRLPRRNGGTQRVASASEMREPLSVRAVGEGEFFGFALSGNHRFVLGDSFAVTHNSENVFLVDAGNNDIRVKIGDFGEAKAMQDKWLMTRYVGTAEFRAPEVYGATAKGHNEKADIWSYGMVLFELLTLDLPYRATVKSHFEVPALVEKGIRATLPELPPLYAEVLPVYLNCTEAEPKDRPPAKELVKRLKKMVSKREAAKKEAKDKKDKEKALTSSTGATSALAASSTTAAAAAKK